MLYREMIAVCPDLHIKHLIVLCGQYVDFINAESVGKYSNQ
jgi:hypothetical protein